MLRIAVGQHGYMSSISRDGERIPAIEATISMSVEKPTMVWIKTVEFDGENTKYNEFSVLGGDNEEIQIVQA
jgi:hypothetical protein